jgi:hypothetical protein
MKKAVFKAINNSFSQEKAIFGKNKSLYEH